MKKCHQYKFRKDRAVVGRIKFAIYVRKNSEILKQNFYVKSHVFIINRKLNLWPKSAFLSKIEILVENRNFG